MLYSPQEEINLQVLQVLQGLQDKKKGKDIPSTWKQTILPAIVCTKLIALNDKPQATYAQVVYVKAAQVLLKIYELYDLESDPSTDPDVIDISSA